MKKKSILPIILSAITFVSLAVPAVATAVADTANASNERTITVDIFSGNEDGVELGVSKNKDGVDQGTISAVTDGEDTVISIVPTEWGSFNIAMKNPVDMNKDGVQICFEIKATGNTTWADVRGIHFTSGWNQVVKLTGENLNCKDDYVVKKYDLSPTMTTGQLAVFKGLSIATSSPFNVKRVWVEYPNPDYVEETPTEGVYKLVTEPVGSVQDSTYQYAVTIPSTYTVKSGDKIKMSYTLPNIPSSGKSIDVSIGGVAVLEKGIWTTTETGTWEYTFDKEFSGDIRFGVRSMNFTIDYLELTIYSNGTETKKIKFYDENGGVIESLSSVEYDVTAENVLPEYSAAGKLFIGWKIGEGLYPAGGAFDVATTDSATAAAIEFGTNGAYFRIGETASVSGIRFDTEFSAQDYANIGNFVTEYGTLILPEDTLNGKELTLENFVAHETVLKVKSTTATTADEKTSFRGAIFSIKEANYNRTFAARGYITVTFSDGSTKNFYSATTAENSVASMAASFMGSEGYNQLGEEQKAIVRAYAEAYQA